MGDSEEEAGPVTWRIELTPTAQTMLAEIKDRRVLQKIVRAIDGLAHEPEKQGKALTSDLSGYRSLRAGGQRYRVIYKVERGLVVVLVLAVGLRKEGSKKDVYSLAQRLLRLGLLQRSGEKVED